MSTVTKPVMLDETGKEIVEALKGFTQSIENGSLAVKGESAGFGTITTKITEDGGAANVEVTTSGEDSAKNFEFDFQNLQGESTKKGTGIEITKAGHPAVATISLDAATQASLAKADKAASDIENLQSQVGDLESQVGDLEDNQISIKGEGGISANTVEHVATIKIDDTTMAKINKIDTVESTANNAKSTAEAALPKAGGTMTGSLTLNAAPSKDLEAATKKYVDDQVKTASDAASSAASAKVARAGDTMTGLLTLSADPTNDMHAATKKYVDAKVKTASDAASSASTEASGKVSKSGDTMTGLLTLSADPTSNMHAATKKYVDAQVKTAKDAAATAQSAAEAAQSTADGKADKTHVHKAGDITTGTLSVDRGGTGITSNPSMTVNLASGNADNVFKATPSPGVTGVLPLTKGGTGVNAASNAALLSALSAQGKASVVTVSIAVNDWGSGTTCNKSVTGVSATETAQLIIPICASASKAEYDSKGVTVTAQAANQLTFSCSSKPASALTVYIVIFPLT